MPFPLIPVIGASLGLIGQGINAASTSAANNATKNFQLMMYERQRQDSLADWNRQNEYNSPLMQMTRFKDAGLNPNLIYGQSNTAQPVRSSSAGNYKQEAPQFQLGQIFSEFVNLTMQQKRMDLMQEDIRLRQQQVDLTQQKYASELNRQDLQAADLDLKQQKYGYLEEMNPLYKNMQTLKNEALEQENLYRPSLSQVRIDLQNAQVRDYAEKIANYQIQRLEAQSRIETNTVRKELMLQQMENLKAALHVINVKGEIAEKDRDFYEVKGVINAIGNVVGKAKDFLPATGSGQKTPRKYGVVDMETGEMMSDYGTPLGGYKHGKSGKSWFPK